MIFIIRNDNTRSCRYSPENGYKRICEEYNLNRGDLPPIKKAGVYEGGFEVPIHFNEG